MDNLMPPGAVAVYLHVPLATLYAWSSRGEGPPRFKIGRHLRYRLADVDAWLEDHAAVHTAMETRIRPIRRTDSPVSTRGASPVTDANARRRPTAGRPGGRRDATKPRGAA